MHSPTPGFRGAILRSTVALLCVATLPGCYTWRALQADEISPGSKALVDTKVRFREEAGTTLVEVERQDGATIWGSVVAGKDEPLTPAEPKDAQARAFDLALEPNPEVYAVSEGRTMVAIVGFALAIDSVIVGLMAYSLNDMGPVLWRDGAWYTPAEVPIGGAPGSGAAARDSSDECR